MKTTSPPLLPRLELPERTLLLYESVVQRDADRHGNWRFRFGDDGGFYNARNQPLAVDARNAASDDPAWFWNVPFPERPDRRLDAAQLAELKRAIATAHFPSLAPRYAADPERR